MSSCLIYRKLDAKQLSYTPTALVIGRAGVGKTTLVNKLSRIRHQTDVQKSSVQEDKNIYPLLCDQNALNLIDTLGIDNSLTPKIRAESGEIDIKTDVSATFFLVKYDSRFERMIDAYFELETSLICNAHRIVVMISHWNQSKTPEEDFKEICAFFAEECPDLMNIIFYSEQNVDAELGKLMYNCISNMNEVEQTCHVNKDEVKHSRNDSFEHCQETKNEFVYNCSDSTHDVTFEFSKDQHHGHLMVSDDFGNDKEERRVDKDKKHTCNKYESDPLLYIPLVRLDDTTRKIIKNQEVPTPSMQVNIRNQTTEVPDQFSYVARYVTRDHSSDKKIKTQLSKVSITFNILRSIIWYRSATSIPAKLRLFRACVLPVLIYGNKVWSITVAQERRLNIFYLKCLRAIIGVNLSYCMSNNKLLRLAGQPHLNDILRRNRLWWFGRINRMHNIHNEPSIMRKTMFSYILNCKRHQNTSVRKRWQDKKLTNFDQCQIRNRKRETPDRNRWRYTTINKNAQVKPPSADIKKIVKQVKQHAVDRRATNRNGSLPKVIQLLAQTPNKNYNCPKCNKSFRPQGITNHVRSCAMAWCKKNGIHIH